MIVCALSSVGVLLLVYGVYQPDFTRIELYEAADRVESHDGDKQSEQLRIEGGLAGFKHGFKGLGRFHCWPSVDARGRHRIVTVNDLNDPAKEVLFALLTHLGVAGHIQALMMLIGNRDGV